MNIKKLKVFFTALQVVSITILLLIYSKIGAFEIASDKAEFIPGEQMQVAAVFKTDDFPKGISAFECTLKYDSNILKYTKINCQGPLKRREIKCNKSPNNLSIIYTPQKTHKISFEDDNCKFFEIIFTVKSKAKAGHYTIESNLKNHNPSILQLEIKENPEAENCKLLSIIPIVGELKPNFDPNIFSYNIKVPCETKCLEIQALPKQENLSVKINRKKLNAAGKTTDIVVTVSNKELRIKSVYKITVTREVPNASSTKEKKSEKREKAKNEKSKLLSKETLEKSSVEKGPTQNIFDGSQEKYDYEENNYRIWWICAFLALLLSSAIYFAIKFIKASKNSSKKSGDSINKNFEK